MVIHLGAAGKFFALVPDTSLKFSNFVKFPGIEVLDALVPTSQVLTFATGNINVSSAKLPKELRALFDPLHFKPNYIVFIPQGINHLSAVDLKGIKPMADALKFFGAKDTRILMRTGLIGAFGDLAQVVKKPKKPGEGGGDSKRKKKKEKKKGNPSLSMEATLPTFRPKLGDTAVKIPADVSFSFNANATNEGELTMGIEGETLFRIGKQDVNVVLVADVVIPKNGKPNVNVTATTFRGIPWKGAFGIKWLTIEDYAMTFGIENKAIIIGSGGKTTIGEKTTDMFSTVQIRLADTKTPIPHSFKMAVDDGPNKIGQLGIRDLAAVYNEMVKVTGKKKALINLKTVPDVAITGTKKGEGPAIELDLSDTGNIGFDIKGGLRVMGKNIATVDRAYVNAQDGIQIKAKTTKLAIGPIKMPHADVDILLRSKTDGIDSGDSNVEYQRLRRHASETDSLLPASDAAGVLSQRVLFSGAGPSFFGEKNEMKAVLTPFQTTLFTNQDFGTAFKLKFLATTGQKVKSMGDLAKIDPRIDITMRMDLAKWLKTDAKSAVAKAFDTLLPQAKKAQADLDAAKAKVQKLDGAITAMRKRVGKERADPLKRIAAAKKQVAKLGRDINAHSSRISNAKRQMESCSQTTSVCALWVFGCKKWATVPDVGARASCTVRNAGRTAYIATQLTGKNTLVGSRAVASKTLDTLKKGITNIPIDLDPRVATLIIAKTTATVTLNAAKAAVRGFTDMGPLLQLGLNAIAKADYFFVQKGLLRGSLQKFVAGKPVVLALDYKLLGKTYASRFAYDRTNIDYVYNQLVLPVLGGAVRTVITAAQKAKVVPHALIAELNKVYHKKKMQVDREVVKATATNKGIQVAARKVAGDIGATIANMTTAVQKKGAAVVKKARAVAKKVKAKKQKSQIAQLKKVTTAASAAKLSLAYKKPTRQSSNYSKQGISSHAVDGNLAARWSDYSMIHTRKEKNAFWEVCTRSKRSRFTTGSNAVPRRWTAWC